MEMRARESVDMSEDLTRAIPPCAATLDDAFLHSHCSSCFRKLPSEPPSAVSCMKCSCVRYCSSDCSSSDYGVHSSSSECCFFTDHLKRASPSFLAEGTADPRAALRLLYLLEMRGLASSDSSNQATRIGGLSASGIRETLEEGGEIAKRILEGSMLMWSARKMRAQTSVVFPNGLTVETLALWAVMINCVAVQIGEERDLGIAVYGPSFSWFNHSCLPNASYRFVLAPFNEDSVSDESKYPAVPASKEVAVDAVKEINDSFVYLASSEPSACTCLRELFLNTLHIIIISRCRVSYSALYWLQWRSWQFEDDSVHVLSKYGPRVVVRCTKPINKGDEVCITYIDILQSREARHSYLRSKYKFICSCKRCTSSPEPYVDLLLNCDFRNLNSPEEDSMSLAIIDLDDILQQAISVYSSGDDPKACCDMIETMLTKNLMADLHVVELPQRRHILHPLHHICLRAYIALASAYRFRALTANTQGENSDVSFEMTKAAAAYSFILAGATHHLFLSELSFMIPLSYFLLSTGQSLLDLVECFKGETRKNISEAKFSFPSCSSSSAKRDFTQCSNFRSTCGEFGKRMLSLSLQCWPFLVQSSPCLEKIKNPIDYSWLGTAVFQPLHLSEEDFPNFSCTDGLAMNIEKQKECILSLAVCCITFCKYLGNICYGPEHYLANRADDLLEGIDLGQ